MKFSAFSLFTAFVAAVSASTTPDTSKPPSGNPIYAPELDQQVPVGEEFEIVWDPTTEGKVSILLLRGPSENVVPIGTIVDSIDNTGSYIWTPDTNLENDVTHYGLQIVVEGTGQYQYSSQFGIKNDGKGEDEPEQPEEPGTDEPPVETAPVTTLITTICPSGVPTPTGGVPVPTGSGVPPPPPGTTSWAVVPTPTPSSPPYNNGAGRNAVGLTGAAVALAAVLAF